MLVDLQYKDTQWEKAFRAAKASFNPWWHRIQAKKVVEFKKWFSAIFHYSQLLKNDPEQSEYFDGLHLSHKKLVAKYKADRRGFELHLPEAVQDVLQLSPGKN